MTAIQNLFVGLGTLRVPQTKAMMGRGIVTRPAEAMCARTIIK